MGVQKKNNKALRFNGFTDGLVVPTGAFKESGVDLTRPGYSKNALNTKSTATKTGRLHIPNETNPLNGLFGPFTLDAYVIPDSGGSIFFKEGSYRLEVGAPFLHFQDKFKSGYGPFGVDTEGSIRFTIFTSGREYTLESNFSLHRGVQGASLTNRLYSGGICKPQDTGIKFNGLYLITAQFTGIGMKLFLNTQLIAEMSFGGDTKVIDGHSSDLFIGGRGGEYRGIIESVRVNRGVTDPKLGMLLRSDSTIGLWTFDDEDIMENIRFFGSKHPGSDTQGEDGLADDGGLFDIPMVLTGIDFGNISTVDNQSLGLFRIRDRLNDSNAGIEKLLSILTGVALKDIENQAWWQQGSLLFTTQEAPDAINNAISDHSALTGGVYEVPITKRNLIINHSGTHPATGQVSAPKTGIRFPYIEAPDPFSVVSNTYLSSNMDVDLDPMVNPIERVKLLGLLITTNRDVYLMCGSIIGLNNEDATNSPYGIGGVENAMGVQGFRYHHADNTPVWIVAGTSDLNIDEGNKKTNTTANPNQVTRAKDTWTRANFTRGNRFVDSSGNNNDAYFISPQSRISKKLLDQGIGILPPKTVSLLTTATTVFPPTDPPTGDLLYWHHAGAGPTSGNVNSFRDLSGNKHFFYQAGIGNFVKNSADTDFGGHGCYEVVLSTTDGLGLVNINTDDGEGVRITTPLLDTGIHSGGFTVFLFMKPRYVGTNNFNYFNHAGPTSNYEVIASPAGAQSFTFNGVTLGPRASAPPPVTGLYAFQVFEEVGVKIKEFEKGITPLAGAIGGAALGSTADISWANNLGITTLFGKCTAVDTALKTATTFTNGFPDGMKWSEILIYNGKLDALQIADINGYFIEKYGFI